LLSKCGLPPNQTSARILLPESLTRELCPDYVDFKPELSADKSMALSMKDRPLFVTIEKIIFTILLNH
jgi:hypothetical protein